MGELTYN